MRSVTAPLLAIVAALGLIACGEPAVDVDIPDRAAGQHLLDAAGILDTAAVEGALADASQASGLDVVGLAFTDGAANLGQADRGGRALLDAWDADVVVVAVAAPGDFTSVGADRRRFFGVFSGDRFDVPRSVRERIVGDVASVPAGANDWTSAFTGAAEALATSLAARGGG
ncbi:MAG: hypothetical protein H0V93_01895 [Euzebyales bacterium]|nr:hypothetical protein [Euzebyales bacterium]